MSIAIKLAKVMTYRDNCHALGSYETLKLDEQSEVTWQIEKKMYLHFDKTYGQKTGQSGDFNEDVHNELFISFILTISTWYWGNRKDYYR